MDHCCVRSLFVRCNLHVHCTVCSHASLELVKRWFLQPHQLYFTSPLLDPSKQGAKAPDALLARFAVLATRYSVAATAIYCETYEYAYPGWRQAALQYFRPVIGCLVLRNAHCLRKLIVCRELSSGMVVAGLEQCTRLEELTTSLFDKFPKKP